MLRRWVTKPLIAMGYIVLVSAMGFGVWVWRASAPQDMAPLEARQAAWRQAMVWVKTHEDALLRDPNSALWWMLRHAAEAAADAELQALVARHLEWQYPPLDGGYSPWRRLIDGRSPVAPEVLTRVAMTPMAPYQRDFLQAASCQMVPAADAHVSGDFLVRNLCRPNLWHTLTQDKVCATHQLMTLQVHRQSGCAGGLPATALRAELLADVQSQIMWLPVFEDAYIQRVLMLYWQRGGAATRPVWFNRVLMAQRADGGWAGERWVLELPLALQPSSVRNALWARLGRQVRPVESDFHATAQAMLLVALSLKSDHQGVWALNEQ
ncbi:MAG: hypothetical protein RLZZ182_738 [Pseudomonadota bacterium]|jgi:diadenosine tetraphosphatase ApaH/serine/threonine PP2A family protein phosphatase